LKVTSRVDALLSIIGFRTGAAGLMLVLAPRWFRQMLMGLAKLSDNELRIVGYVLFGTGASILAQRAVKHELSSKIDALVGERRPLPAATPG
jgi:uncharacterized protein YjeT (DUF2065 family)